MVLKLVWAFVPQNVKGELWLDAYELALYKFCDGLQIPKLN